MKYTLLLFFLPLVAWSQPRDPGILRTIRKMTLGEKVALLHGNGLFSTAGVPRLGISPLQLDDGPLGVREEVRPDWTPAGLRTDSATFFPNGSALAATWNPALARRYGQALGAEAHVRGKDVILAPAINLARTPLGGRTYEYLSEDPWLNARLVVPVIKGIQSAGTAACVKHFALNNQEWERQRVDVDLSERALQELYLPAFRAAVTEGKAWTLMTAYNKVRGRWCAENPYLLQQVLRRQWKFDGVIISDWNGTHSTLASARAGLDLEMGTEKPFEQYYFADPLLEAVRSGALPERLIDEKVYRLLWLRKMTGRKPAYRSALNGPENIKTAYDIAAESTVLLKNNGMLPLKEHALRQVAVIGANAIQYFQRGGFGAGVKARTEVNLFQGLEQRLGTARVNFAPGYSLTDTTAKGRHVLIGEAAKLAAQCDVAIVCIGGNRDYESENRDRTTLQLPYHQEELAAAVHAANPNTVVVVIGGAPYDLGRLDRDQAALLWTGYGGSLGGLALADVLTGRINPSGRLPFTFPARLEDSPAHASNAYPGDSLNEFYKEDLLVGYRWFVTRKIRPLYPFGYGLSYTTFRYGTLQVDADGQDFRVRFRLYNTGERDGKEVVQLYTGLDGSRVMRPTRELKAFAKIAVPAHSSRIVSLRLKRSELAYFDPVTAAWQVEAGSYRLEAGASATAIRQRTVFRLH